MMTEYEKQIIISYEVALQKIARFEHTPDSTLSECPRCIARSALRWTDYFGVHKDDKLQQK
jgi:hypothetical protein